MIADKRDAILRSTLYLVSRQGFHATPMSQISRHSRVSTGNIYHYFAGKKELINALFLDIKSRLSEYVRRNYAGGSTVEDNIKELYKCVIRYSVEHRDEVYFAEQFESSPLLSSATREEALRMDEPLRGLFGEARDLDLLKDLPFEVLNSLIYGAVISLVKHCLSGKIRYDEAVIEKALAAVWDMVRR